MKPLKPSVLISLSLFAVSRTEAQKIHFSLVPRIGFQIDDQRARYVDRSVEISSVPNTLNYTIDVLGEGEIGRVRMFAGIGFYRNKYPFKRSYDHMALNEGRDSFPVKIYAKSYQYSTLRLPIGLGFTLIRARNFSLNCGIEYDINFTIARSYDGPAIYNGATTSHFGLNYWGGNLNALATIKWKRLALIPFVRCNNVRRQDRFLYEDENSFQRRSFDSYGVSFSYHIPLKPKRL